MRSSELRVRDSWDEYVILNSWDADSFAEETGLTPLDSWSARSQVGWWVRGRGPIADALIQHILEPSPHGVFLPNAAEHAVENAFLISWKVFKLPRPERKPIKIAADVAGASEPYVPPPAPPPPTEEAPPKTWFEVKVVDEFGKPIDGLEVVFSQGSRQETLETNGAGVVRWKDVEGPSFASVKVANVATLRDLLKPRYAKGGERKTPEGPDVTKVMLGVEDPGKALSAETPGILVIAKPLTRVRLIGMHFDTNKCFLREPAMQGIRKVVSVYKANPTGKLLIVGHTDTTADDAYNLDLSVERAEAVKAYLKDDVAAWEAWFGDGKPEKKRWGSREINEMIKALPCEKSVADFQQWSNDTRGTDLKVDGIAGPKTRKALIEAYMALDGTTLPKSIEAVVHGCGEYFPRKDEKDQYGKDNVEAEENRRVEMFCFDDEIQPPVPGKRGSKGQPEYPQWQKQVTNEVDLGTADVESPLEVTIFAPPDIETSLLIGSAANKALQTLPATVGTRDGDNVTFELDPYSMPNPTILRAVWGTREEELDAPFDPVARARELRKGTAPESLAAVSTKMPSSAGAPATAIYVQWTGAKHFLVKTMTLKLVHGSESETKAAGDASSAEFAINGTSKQLRLYLQIKNPYASSEDDDVLYINQQLVLDGGKVQFSPHRRLVIVAKQVPGGSLRINIAVDLTFLDVTSYVRGNSFKNPTYKHFMDRWEKKLACQTLVLEHTLGTPATWLVSVPPSFDKSRLDANVLLFFMNELDTRVQQTNPSLPGQSEEDKNGYHDCRDADYERAQADLTTPGQGKHVFGEGQHEEYPDFGWDSQLAAAGKPVLLALPLPNHQVDFGALAAPNQKAKLTLDALLAGLWAEEVVANSSSAQKPSLKRLAIGGWSSGTNTLLNWIVSDDLDLASEAYYFDGVDDSIWPGKTPDEKHAAIVAGIPATRRSLKGWMNRKEDRRLSLIGTAYTEFSAQSDYASLKGFFASRIQILPSDRADFWFTSDDYANSFVVSSQKEFLETAPVQAKDVIGRSGINKPDVSTSSVSGIFVGDYPDPKKSKGPNKPDAKITTKSAALFTRLLREVASKTFEFVLPRASLAEASWLVRYEAIAANSSLVVPPNTKNEFDALTDKIKVPVCRLMGPLEGSFLQPQGATEFAGTRGHPRGGRDRSFAGSWGRLTRLFSGSWGQPEGAATA